MASIARVPKPRCGSPDAWPNDAGNWFRLYGNKNREFDEQGLMAVRHASINDRQSADAGRKFRWPQGRRPDDHPGLGDLGL